MRSFHSDHKCFFVVFRFFRVFHIVCLSFSLAQSIKTALPLFRPSQAGLTSPPLRYQGRRGETYLVPKSAVMIPTIDAPRIIPQQKIQGSASCILIPPFFFNYCGPLHALTNGPAQCASPGQKACLEFPSAIVNGVSCHDVIASLECRQLPALSFSQIPAARRMDSQQLAKFSTCPPYPPQLQ